jgi:Ran GTPase-activating protein (RanGAP) involved in mRNA processing and transport
LTWLDLSSNYLEVEGAKIVADAIKVTNCALTKIDISKNEIRAEGVKALACALRGNQVVTALNIASNKLATNSSYSIDMSGIIALADVIPGMGALTKLDMSNNAIKQGQALRQITECCSTKGIELKRHESESDGDGDC